MKSCVHFYFGDGKGKSTAAIGLAARYLGWGGKVLVVQFMKGAESGEVQTLQMAGATVLRLSHDYGFYPYANCQGVIEEHAAMLARAVDFAAQKGGLLILDESITAYSYSLLPEAPFIKLLVEKPCEIVCTGHAACKALSPYADYITYMQALKHPMAFDLPARRGIEF